MKLKVILQQKKLCSIKKNNSSHNIPASYSACYKQIKSSFISLNELELEEIEVFPNPAINKITIRSTNSELHSVSIFDINGKFINQTPIKENNVIIDLQGLSKGIYTLKIISKKGIITKKIVKN